MNVALREKTLSGAVSKYESILALVEEIEALDDRVRAIEARMERLRTAFRELRLDVDIERVFG